MPIVGYFQGIKVYIYFRDHEPPHVHVEYVGEWATLRIADGSVYAGRLPPHTLRIARAWVMKHNEELMKGWSEAQEGRNPQKIKSKGKGGKRRG